MDRRTILLIEDDKSVREGVADALRSEGYAVLTAPDGATGLELGLTQDPDLIVLDLMLPRLDGYEVLRRLRADAVETPVLVLTARGLERDKVKGFELGADDYLVKPFGLAEFLARVASRLRAWDRERGLRSRAGLRFGGNRIDFAGRTAVRDGRNLQLTPMEFELLRYFAAHEGRALSRAALLEGVWTDRPETVSRVVDTAVLGLRKKLERNPSKTRHLLSVRGVGYRFTRRADRPLTDG